MIPLRENIKELHIQYTPGYLFRLIGSKRLIPDSIVTLVDNRSDKNSGSEAQIVEM